MPRYYFHIFNDDVTQDEEGLELPDDAAARMQGEREARILACESIREFGHLILHHRIEIENDNGEKVATITFDDSIDVQP